MKRRFLLLSFFIALFSLLIEAAETTVLTSEELKTVVEAAQDGDVVIIGQSDTEISQTALNVTKKIKIKAADNLSSKPILKLGIVLKNGGSIHLDGLKIYYDTDESGVNTDSKYAVQAVAEVATIEYIRITNCEAANFGRGLIRADHTTNIATIGEINIDNTIVRNASSVSNTYATLSTKTAKIAKIRITNSTFLNAKSGVISSEDTTTPLDFLMDKVTIYNCAHTGNKDIIGLSKAPAGSTIAISNTLMYFSKAVAESDTLARLAINLPSAASLSLTNSVVLSNLFPTKMNAVIKPASTSTSWTAYDVNSTVTEVVMNPNYTITMLPVQLTTIGDPRSHAHITGLDQKTSADFSVYPNPVTDRLLFNREFAQIEVFNLLGMRVAGASNTNNLSVKELDNGHYLILTRDENGQQMVRKIVKK